SSARSTRMKILFILYATMGQVSISRIRPGFSLLFSDFNATTGSRDSVSAWQRYQGSSSDTAAGSGPKARKERGPHSILPSDLPYELKNKFLSLFTPDSVNLPPSPKAVIPEVILIGNPGSSRLYIMDPR